MCVFCSYFSGSTNLAALTLGFITLHYRSWAAEYGPCLDAAGPSLPGCIYRLRLRLRHAGCWLPIPRAPLAIGCIMLISLLHEFQWRRIVKFRQHSYPRADGHRSIPGAPSVPALVPGPGGALPAHGGAASSARCARCAAGPKGAARATGQGHGPAVQPPGPGCGAADAGEEGWVGAGGVQGVILA